MDRSAAEVLNSVCAFERMRVRTTDGRELGHVFDLRGHWEPGRPTVIEEIIMGRTGLLERVGFRERKPQSVPWSGVRSVREDVIVVDPASVRP